MARQSRSRVQRVQQAAQLLAEVAEELPPEELEPRERKALARAVGHASESLGALKRAAMAPRPPSS